MAMEPQAQAAPGGEQPQGGSPENALMNMIVSTDQALTQISQVLAGVSPEAGQALEQLNGQYRQIIEGAMAQGSQRQQPVQEAPMETGGAAGARPVM